MLMISQCLALLWPSSHAGMTPQRTVVLTLCVPACPSTCLPTCLPALRTHAPPTLLPLPVDRYKLLDKIPITLGLADGRFTTIWQATDTTTGKAVVLKV